MVSYAECGVVISVTSGFGVLATLAAGHPAAQTRIAAWIKCFFPSAASACHLWIPFE